MVIEVDDPVYGPMLQPGINARLSRTPGRVRHPAPRPDQHRVRDSVGAQTRPGTTPPSEVMSTLRAALSGVRVLDLCIILAGPTCGRTLAEFGADVIKIDNPARGGYMQSHNDVNRGKRSIMLDLKSAEGRDIFWRLVDTADVVAQNYRAGKLAKLGLRYEEVRKRKPDIIYASLNAYGHLGPWAGRPGHEQFAQATTGMQRRFGGDGQPTLQPNPVNDYGTGFMGAYAVALALLHRQRTGEGQHVDSALAYTAMTLQSPYMQRYDGKRWDEPRGQDDPRVQVPCTVPIRRVTAGFLLAPGPTNVPRLASVEGWLKRESLVSARRSNRRWSNVSSTTPSRTGCRDARRRVSVRIAASWISLSSCKIPWVVDHELSATREHDEIGLVTTCGPAPRLSRTPVQIGHPASKPGSDTSDILPNSALKTVLKP